HIKTAYPVAAAIGGQYGLNHERKKSLARQREFTLPESRTEKEVGYPERIYQDNRKYALRILNRREPKTVILQTKGGTVKLKPSQKRLANRTGKKSYPDDVIASLRLIWTFFWYTCGRTEGPQLLPPAYEAAASLQRLIAGLWHHGGHQGKAATDKSRYH
ncbi:MAG: hypothetical protein LBD93_01170, partial [Treponema sp.]|nr:hypothetical protein [Treponema sp.]